MIKTSIRKELTTVEYIPVGVELVVKVTRAFDDLKRRRATCTDKPLTPSEELVCDLYGACVLARLDRIAKKDVEESCTQVPQPQPVPQQEEDEPAF